MKKDHPISRMIFYYRDPDKEQVQLAKTECQTVSDGNEGKNRKNVNYLEMDV
jgi:hypothetical protein